MFLVCGASGLVGFQLCNLFDKLNIDYYGTYNSRKIDKPNMIKVNFSSPEEIEELLTTKKIKCCIFSIVERVTDTCENDWNAIKNTNINMVNTVSYICNKLDIKFIHISTDYVFDGSKQPNFPEDQKNPLQNYGISKLISELKVETNCKKNNYCIIRTPVLYSCESKLYDNAVTLIGKNVMDLRSNVVSEDAYSIRRPLYIQDLCHFIYDCCVKDDRIGTYHFYNPYNKFTKYEVANKIANILSIDISKKIKPNMSKGSGLAPRPYDTQLMDNRYEIKSYKFSDFDKTLKECFSKYAYPPLTENMHDAISPKDYFFMIDLDGTLIVSEKAQYNAYRLSFKEYGRQICSFDEWKDMINTNTVDSYLKTLVDQKTFHEIKKLKSKYIEYEKFEYTNNSEFFIDFLNRNNINYCIVTNTGKETVNAFKKNSTMLSSIENFICREDYERPKPSSDPYLVAKEKFYKGEKYVIGIEDTIAGIQSLQRVVDIKMLFNNKDVFKTENVYLFDDFKQII